MHRHPDVAPAGRVLRSPESQTPSLVSIYNGLPFKMEGPLISKAQRAAKIGEPPSLTTAIFYGPKASDYWGFERG